ncbi:hypothetical protein UlMin_039263 [Ulmus minor]
MYNSDRNGSHHHFAPMSPRISFSNDFVDAQQAINQEIRRSSSREAPVSSDFEFSVTNYSMMSADELFSKGRLLPFKADNSNRGNQRTTTLRDELLVGDGDDDFSLRPPKGSSTRWKSLLGLKRTHIGSKKGGKSCDIGSSSMEGRRASLVHEDVHVGNTSQDMLNEGGSSCRDVDIGI